MENTTYYKYYEILFSLRKEYLKNQEIINQLLSHVNITNNSFKDYSPNLIFRTNTKDNTDYLLLLISKRQSYIRLLFKSLYEHIVDSDPLLEQGKYLYVFRLTKDYVYLLDGNQDGRYLNSNVSITNPKEFIELYKLLMENVLCKKGKTYLRFDDLFLQLSNNGIHLSYHPSNIKKNNITLDYDGIEDLLMTSDTSYIKNLMELNINKNAIPTYYRNIIDNNMEDYSYNVEEKDNSKKGFYKIDNTDKKLILINKR